MTHWSMAQVAKTIDHAVLKPTQTEADLIAAAELCRTYEVASLCVKPCDVRKAATLLAGSPVMVSCVLSFPHGADTTPVKVAQAEQAIADGVQEIDMVINIGRLISNDLAYVQADLYEVVQCAHQHNVPVKVILETSYLDDAQIVLACELCLNVGADFVKTSTGFAPEGATPHAVKLMIDTVGDRAQVKASGGIRDWATAIEFLEMGVTRLGVGGTEALLNGAQSESAY